MSLNLRKRCLNAMGSEENSCCLTPNTNWSSEVRGLPTFLSLILCVHSVAQSVTSPGGPTSPEELDYPPRLCSKHSDLYLYTFVTLLIATSTNAVQGLRTEQSAKAYYRNTVSWSLQLLSFIKEHGEEVFCSKYDWSYT
jgi:hypothetical protein